MEQGTGAGGGVRALMRRGAVVTSAIGFRGIAQLAQVGLVFFLARLIDTDGVGVYYLYVSWVTLFAAFLDFGFPNLILRDVAKLTGEHDGAARALVLRVLRAVALSGGALSLIVIAASGWLSRVALDSADRAALFRLAAPSALLFTMLYVIAQALKARGRVNIAIALQFGLVPLLVLGGVGGAAAFGWQPGAVQVMAIHLGSLATATAVAAAVLFGPWRAPREASPPLDARALSGLWFAFLAQNLFFASPFLLLPHFATDAEIGYFAVAHRVVALAGNILEAVGSLYAPRFAMLHSSNRITELRREFRAAQRWGISVFAPIALVYLIAPRQVMSVFGSSFKEGVTVLIILCVGRLADASTGNVSYFLWMTGRQVTELVVTLCATGAMAVAAVALGPSLGVLGVAVAYSVGYSARNITEYLIVTRRALSVDQIGHEPVVATA